MKAKNIGSNFDDFLKEEAILDRGRERLHPLPPNPVCGSPATGSPVSCFLIGIGAPIDGLRTS